MRLLRGEPAYRSVTHSPVYQTSQPRSGSDYGRPDRAAKAATTVVELGPLSGYAGCPGSRLEISSVVLEGDGGGGLCAELSVFVLKFHDHADSGEVESGLQEIPDAAQPVQVVGAIASSAPAVRPGVSRPRAS